LVCWGKRLLSQCCSIMLILLIWHCWGAFLLSSFLPWVYWHLLSTLSNCLSRECLNLSCLPKPSFADNMVCPVGDMMSLVMSPTWRHCMLARVSKRHDIWRHWQHVADI
jgi:hypothetical protein